MIAGRSAGVGNANAIRSRIREQNGSDRVPAPRKGADDYDFLYPCKDPPWVVRTIWNLVAPSQFGAMKCWSRDSVLEMLALVMGGYRDSGYLQSTRDLPLYLVKLSERNVHKHNNLFLPEGCTHHLCDVITAPNLGIQPKQIVLQLKGTLGTFLNLSTDVHGILLILGGTYNVTANTLQFHPRVTSQKTFVSLPVKIFNFIEGTEPENCACPFNVNFSTSVYQLAYQLRKDSTLLKVMEKDPRVLSASQVWKLDNCQRQPPPVLTPELEKELLEKSEAKKRKHNETIETENETDKTGENETVENIFEDEEELDKYTYEDGFDIIHSLPAITPAQPLKGILKNRSPTVEA